MNTVDARACSWLFHIEHIGRQSHLRFESITYVLDLKRGYGFNNASGSENIFT
jgi:hypothetical protein